MTANEGMSVVFTEVAPNDGAEVAKAMKGLNNLPVGYSDELENHLNEYLTKLDTEADAEEAAKYLSTEESEGAETEVVSNDSETSGGNSETGKAVSEQKEDPGLARLMAREKEVADKERAFEEKVAAAVKSKLPDFRGKGPEEVLKLAGLDPDLALKQMMFEKASDSNPVKAKLREELRDYHTKKELDSMRAELESRDAQARQQQYFQTVNDGARSYVEKVDEKVAPVFSQLAKAELNYAHQRVMQEIIRDAQSRAARGEDGEPMSYEAAVKAVESDLSILAKVLASKQTDVTPGKKSAVVSPAMKTSKPLVKQYKEPTSDDLIAKAIEDSVKMFHQEEAKAKGR
jgi:hypothetical protein